MNYATIGGMIQANLKDAEGEDRLDKRLLKDAKSRSDAVASLFAKEAKGFRDEMERRVAALRET